MPRKSRFAPAGMIFHVLNRGKAREENFSKEADYEAFEHVLVENQIQVPCGFSVESRVDEERTRRGPTFSRSRPPFRVGILTGENRHATRTRVHLSTSRTHRKVGRMTYVVGFILFPHRAIERAEGFSVNCEPDRCGLRFAQFVRCASCIQQRNPTLVPRDLRRFC